MNKKKHTKNYGFYNMLVVTCEHEACSAEVNMLYFAPLEKTDFLSPRTDSSLVNLYPTTYSFIHFLKI